MTTAAVTNHERSPVGERVMAGGVSTAAPNRSSAPSPLARQQISNDC